MKYYRLLGVTACIILIISCFLPWTWHADVQKTFTGFYSEQNNYGKPGKFLVFFGVVSAAMIMLNKVWAKRVHLFMSALFLGYAIKSYILFSSCYNAYCPEKQYGLFLMLGATIAILVIVVFPKLKLPAQHLQM